VAQATTASVAGEAHVSRFLAQVFLVMTFGLAITG
jgi:hypothetical protein